MIPQRVEKYRDVWSTVPGQVGLPDPYLVAAIGDRESLWGEALTPPGPTGTGDGGHGRGLLQVDDRAWPAWCAERDSYGDLLWQNPTENVRQGCRVLMTAWMFFLNWPATIAAYNCGRGRVQAVLTQAGRVVGPTDGDVDLLHILDFHTTGHDYVTDVVDRWARYKGLEGPIHFYTGGLYAVAS